jgi:hypothetical protein
LSPVPPCIQQHDELNPPSMGAEPNSHFLPCRERNQSSLLAVYLSSVTVDNRFFNRCSHFSCQWLLAASNVKLLQRLVALSLSDLWFSLSCRVPVCYTCCIAHHGRPVLYWSALWLELFYTSIWIIKYSLHKNYVLIHSMLT